MSKGIIVVDIPENCLNCGCKLCFDRSYYCGAKARYLDDWEFDIQNEKPDWCPIRQIPVQPPLNMALTPILEDSWNASIKEIMGNKVMMWERSYCIRVIRTTARNACITPKGRKHAQARSMR